MTYTGRSIFEELARQAEQPERKRVARVRLTPERHPRYFAPDGAGEKEALHRELGKLEAAGTLRLYWHKHERGNLLDAVDLVRGREDRLYQVIGHTPTDALEQRVHEALQRLEPRTAWLQEYRRAVSQALERHHQPATWGLDPSDARRMRDVIRGLNALPGLERTTLTRVFSAQVLGDSKRFDAIERDLLKALRRVSPYRDTASEDRDLLLAHNLQRVPTLTQVYGALALRIDGALLDLRSWPAPIGLHASLIERAQVDARHARALLTVENPASFELLTELAPRHLAVVLTAGYPSSAVLLLLKAIVEQRVLAFHWGDIDIGGFRILAHLRRHAGAFRPLAMGAAELHDHAADLHPLTQKDAQAGAALLEHPLLADCGAAIAALPAGKLEQESIAPTYALEQLQARLRSSYASL